MYTFGQRLNELRNTKNMSQEDLAKQLKISKSAIGMYERDQREPSFELINQIADYFNVTVDYLMGRTNLPNINETNMSFFGGPENYTQDEIEEMEAALMRYRRMKQRAREEAEKEK